MSNPRPFFPFPFNVAPSAISGKRREAAGNAGAAPGTMRTVNECRVLLFFAPTVVLTDVSSNVATKKVSVAGNKLRTPSRPLTSAFVW